MALFDDSFWDDFETQMRAFRKQMENLTAMALKCVPVMKEPASDIAEKDNKLVIRLDMPGIKKEDIQLMADENSVEVRAERKEEKVEKDKQYYRHERMQKSYYRLLPLPTQIKPNTITAEYTDGVLTIEAEKKTAKKEEKKIKIKVK